MITLTKQLLENAVKTKQIPGHLYKYRTINEYLEKLITNSELYFSKPGTFNDPWDCQIEVDTSNSEEELTNYLRSNMPEASTNEIENWLDLLKSKPSTWNDIVNEAKNKIVNSKGICCFCAVNDNILLWSYYADGHAGVCLKFDIVADTPLFSVPFPAKYRDDYPMYNHIRDKNNIVNDLLLSKSKVWSHEKEYRIIKNNQGPVKFDPLSLVEVIFGCKCTEENINKITLLLKNNGYERTELKKCSVKKGTYELEIKDL